MKNEKRYFLKNANLLEEIHNSKLTYCCCEDDRYSMYDIICKDYKLITPNIISNFFSKNPQRDYIVVRVMANEHVLPYCKNEKVNLQELKMKPFKHFYILREDFDNANKIASENFDLIESLNTRIAQLKEDKKDNARNIRIHKLEPEKQVPYKEKNKKCDEEIVLLTDEIKKLSETFSEEIMKNAREVVRSHWCGKTIEEGHFDVSHGHLSDGLVYMIIMLVDQYAKSGNWSGYTYLDDMKGSALVHLCDVALKFEESESTNAFSYLTQVASNKFTATLNSEKYQRKIKSKMMQEAGYNPTFGEMVDEEYKNMMLELAEETEEDSSEDESSIESND